MRFLGIIGVIKKRIYGKTQQEKTKEMTELEKCKCCNGYFDGYDRVKYQDEYLCIDCATWADVLLNPWHGDYYRKGGE